MHSWSFDDPILKRAFYLAAGSSAVLILVVVAVLAEVTIVFHPPVERILTVVTLTFVIIGFGVLVLGSATVNKLGLERGKDLGLVFKNSSILGLIGKINLVIFNKTGILTQGKPEITDIISNPLTPISDVHLLKIAASLGQSSKDPLAESFVEAAGRRGIRPSAVTRLRAWPGLGVEGFLDNLRILQGSKRFMEERFVKIDALKEKAEKLMAVGKTLIYLAIEGEFAGLLVATDTVKPTAQAAVLELRKMNILVGMITSDHQSTARAVAAKLGIERVMAEVLPDHKADEVKKLRRKNTLLAVVGNSISDSSVLAAADIGISACPADKNESASLVLKSSDPELVVSAIRLSQKVKRIFYSNLFLISFYNIIGAILAALVLFPAVSILISPLLAVASVLFFLLLITMNSGRLKSAKL